MIATIGPSLGGLAAVLALAAGLSVLIGATVLSHQADAPYSAALVYLVLGAGAAVVLNRLDVGWPDALDHLDAVQHLAAAAIVIALFGTGLKIDRTISWQGWSSIVRLLLFAMPLVIAAVAVLGVEALGVPLGVAIMIGAMLAPTDPVLAGEIGVGPPGESDEREERFAITGEAGLNDGLALIFVLFGLGYLESGERSIPNWLLVDVGYSLVAAVAVGLVVGRGVGWLAMRERNRHELDPGVEAFVGLGAAFVLYGAAGSIGANGFIAVFVGALAFRRYERRHELNRGVWDGLERAGRLAELAAIVLLGTALSIDGLASIGWSGWLIVILVLRRHPSGERLPHVHRQSSDVEDGTCVHRMVRRPWARIDLLCRCDRRVRRADVETAVSPLVDRHCDRRRLDRRPRSHRHAGHEDRETPKSARNVSERSRSPNIPGHDQRADSLKPHGAAASLVVHPLLPTDPDQPDEVAGCYQLFTIASDERIGSSSHASRTGAASVGPESAPDGKRIAFLGANPPLHAGVITAAADVSDVQAVTPDKQLLFEGDPSPPRISSEPRRTATFQRMRYATLRR